MKIKFHDIHLAFYYASSGDKWENSALICKETGDIFYRSDDFDDDDMPEDVYDREDCIEMPHKNDLDLGINLIFEFIERCLPGDLERVRDIFSRKGAYGRYKNFLEHRSALDKWHEFEDKRQTETLRQWCEDNGIEVSG